MRWFLWQGSVRLRYRVILSNLCLGFAIIAQTILHPKRLSDSDPMYRREPKELLFNMSKQSTCDTLQRYNDLALTYPLTDTSSTIRWTT